jgi:ribonuclease HI
MLEMIGQPIEESYGVDASCTGNPGPVEYKCVHTTTRQPIFRQGPFENGSNNIGEFLAMAHALALFKKRNITAAVYSNSETAHVWIKNKIDKTKLPRDEKNAPTFDLIARTEDWLGQNEYSNDILKWDTDARGDIPADYRRK